MGRQTRGAEGAGVGGGAPQPPAINNFRLTHSLLFPFFISANQAKAAARKSASRQALPASLSPTSYWVLPGLAHRAIYPELFSPGTGLLFPIQSNLWASWLLYLAPLSPLPSCLLPTWLRDMSTLYSPRRPCPWLCSPTQLQEAFSRDSRGNGSV